LGWKNINRELELSEILIYNELDLGIRKAYLVPLVGRDGRCERLLRAIFMSLANELT